MGRSRARNTAVGLDRGSRAILRGESVRRRSRVSNRSCSVFLCEMWQNRRNQQSVFLPSRVRSAASVVEFDQLLVELIPIGHDEADLRAMHESC